MLYLFVLKAGLHDGLIYKINMTSIIELWRRFGTHTIRFLTADIPTDVAVLAENRTYSIGPKILP